MRKILIGLMVLVLGVTFVVPGLAKRGGWFDASASVDTSVIWQVPAFIELSVSAASFKFPEFDPGIDEYLAKEAMVLYVFSNSEWSLTYELEGDDEAIAHLAVLLAQDSGSGNAVIPVSYQLSNLRDMAPGTYEVTVIYTATAE
ncbi:TPA: hypothetical protein EYH33_01970 [Candidatus Bipolaricaulota bacterium]|nr:hypothetical protein [Candidatus Bipolaricaulota bacterium]